LIISKWVNPKEEEEEEEEGKINKIDSMRDQRGDHALHH
jgi:hypothetical protein